MIIAGSLKESSLKHHNPGNWNEPFGINVFVINYNWRQKLSMVIYLNVKRIEMDDEKVTLYHDEFMLKFNIKEVHYFITEFTRTKCKREKIDYGENFFLNYYVDDKAYFFWESLYLLKDGYKFDLLVAELKDDTIVSKFFRAALEGRQRLHTKSVDFNGMGREIGEVKVYESHSTTLCTYRTKIIVKSRLLRRGEI